MGEQTQPSENSVLQLMQSLPHQPVPRMPAVASNPAMDLDSGVPASARFEVDFALTLARLIDDARNDPAQLRATVYQLARVRLQEQLLSEDAQQLERLTSAFDVAIQRVEAFALQREGPSTHQPYLNVQPGVFHLPGAASAGARMPRGAPASAAPVDTSQPMRSRALASKALDSVLVRSFAVVGLMAGVLAAIFFFQARPGPAQFKAWAFADRPAEAVAAKSAAREPAKPMPDVRRASLAPATTATETAPPPGGFTPMPAGLGVFALSSSKLFKLEPSPGRVPDPRATFSARTRGPAGQKLPNGRVKFVVHRSGAEGRAPETAEVRLVARVARETTFDRSGRPVTAFPEDSWVTRNIAYPYLAAPIGNNDQMYELRSDDAGFVLASGRYTLIHNEVAYDFIVEGPVTESKHCLERLTMASGVLHSECGEALFVH